MLSRPGVGEQLAASPNCGGNPAHEVARAERFDHVVVGFQGERHDLLARRHIAGEDDDRGALIGGVIAQDAAHVETTDPGQIHIQDHAVRLEVPGHGDGVLAARRFPHLESHRRKTRTGKPADIVRVIDDENLADVGALGMSPGKLGPADDLHAGFADQAGSISAIEPGRA